MKKLILILIVLALGFGLGRYAGGKRKNDDGLPERFKASLDLNKPDNDGLQIILKGVVRSEFNKRSQTNELILDSDSGGSYILFNSPYVNALMLNKVFGKTVKIKGLSISKTKYKDFPGIYIQDILELY